MQWRILTRVYLITSISITIQGRLRLQLINVKYGRIVLFMFLRSFFHWQSPNKA